MSIRAADESTEILLCDYLEGKLVPARQREIDAYLQAHPKERVVMEQLRKHRSAMGGLPLEPAPFDVHDAMQSHLERGVLLDSMAELAVDRPPRFRVRPGLIAACAIVGLSATLAVVVYNVVVPPKGVVRPELTRLPPAPPGAGDASPPRDPAASFAAGIHSDSPVTPPPAGASSQLFPPLASGGPKSPSPSAPVTPTAESTESIPLGAQNPGKPLLALGPISPGRTLPSNPDSAAADPGSADTGTHSNSLPRPVPTPPPLPTFSTLTRTDRDPAALGSRNDITQSSESTKEIPADAVTRRVVFYAADPVAARARVETFLKAGGWSYIATPKPTPSPNADLQGQPASPDQTAPSAGGSNAVVSDALHPPKDASTNDQPTEAPLPEASVIPRNIPTTQVTLPQTSPALSSPTTAPTTKPLPPSPPQPASTPSPLTPRQPAGTSELLLVRVELDQLSALAAALERLGDTDSPPPHITAPTTRRTLTPAPDPMPSSLQPSTPPPLASLVVEIRPKPPH